MGVAEGSRTETYVAMRVEIDNWRWGTFHVRTGKRLPRRMTEIALRFQPVPHLPFARSESAKSTPTSWCCRCSRTREPPCAW